MFLKCLFASATILLAVASAATSYRLNLYQPTVINGVALKAGECTLEVQDNTVLIQQGKTKVNAPVQISETEAKNSNTTVRYNVADGQAQIEEIRLRGTNKRLVFGETAAGTAGTRSTLHD